MTGMSTQRPIDRPCTRHRNRDGYVYLSVMLVAALIGVMGLTAIRVGRLHLKSAVGANSAGQAASLSRSAIEHGLATLQNDASWRTTFQNDVEYPAVPVSLGSGTWTWKLVDDDGDLTDDDSDFVRIVGIGRDGDATIVHSAVAYPTTTAIAAMDYAIHGHDNVTLGSGTTISTNDTVGSNGQLSGPGSALISGDAEGTGGVTVPVSGGTTTGTPARQMPGSSVFTYYQTRGTYIPIASLPLSGAVRVLQASVLSPASNPFGTGNAAGIYVIDCASQTIEIRDCRIVGTLLLLNPGAGSRITGAVHWEHAVPGFPALLIDGPLVLNLTSPSLSETALTTNFNPLNAPFQEVWDTDTVDSYSSEINGGLYVAGDLTVSSSVSVTGTVIATGMVVVQSSSTFDFDSAVQTSPPPGFATSLPLQIVPGSQKRDMLP